MYVCICNNVKESDIEQAIAEGASSVKCVEQQLGVGTCCGQCKPRATEYINEQLPALSVQGRNHTSRAQDFNLKLKVTRVTTFSPTQAAHQ